LATENRLLSRVSFKNGAESLFDGISWLPNWPCLTPTTGFAGHQHEGNINKLWFLCFFAVLMNGMVFYCKMGMLIKVFSEGLCVCDIGNGD